MSKGMGAIRPAFNNGQQGCHCEQQGGQPAVGTMRPAEVPPVNAQRPAAPPGWAVAQEGPGMSQPAPSHTLTSPPATMAAAPSTAFPTFGRQALQQPSAMSQISRGLLAPQQQAKSQLLANGLSGILGMFR